VNSPVDVDRERTYQDIYARLVDLCEREAELSGDAHLCVMEAFNDLAEVDLRTPDELPRLFYGPVDDVLGQVRRLLTELIITSSDLETALALIRVDACIEAALQESR
jgi:hypothetical protein